MSPAAAGLQHALTAASQASAACPAAVSTCFLRLSCTTLTGMGTWVSEHLQLFLHVARDSHCLSCLYLRYAYLAYLHLGTCLEA